MLDFIDVFVLLALLSHYLLQAITDISAPFVFLKVIAMHIGPIVGIA
jgi:hypothetical protein